VKKGGAGMTAGVRDAVVTAVRISRRHRPNLSGLDAWLLEEMSRADRGYMDACQWAFATLVSAGLLTRRGAKASAAGSMAGTVPGRETFAELRIHGQRVVDRLALLCERPERTFAYSSTYWGSLPAAAAPVLAAKGSSKSKAGSKSKSKPSSQNGAPSPRRREWMWPSTVILKAIAASAGDMDDRQPVDDLLNDPLDGSGDPDGGVGRWFGTAAPASASDSAPASAGTKAARRATVGQLGLLTHLCRALSAYAFVLEEALVTLPELAEVTASRESGLMALCRAVLADVRAASRGSIVPAATVANEVDVAYEALLESIVAERTRAMAWLCRFLLVCIMREGRGDKDGAA
jgi:hypothetical protein